MEINIANIFDATKSDFSEEKLIRLFSEIADTPGPSQTCRFTRGPVIKRLISSNMVEGMKIDLDYLGTGNCLICSNTVEPSILFIAHLDQISYLIDQKVNRDTWHLIPYCKHLSEIEMTAIGLRFNLSNNDFEEVAKGKLFSEKTAIGLSPFFKVECGDLCSGDRVVYQHPLEVHRKIARGNIDNAAGVTASIIAAMALYKIKPNIPVGFVFTDEEEGPSINPSFFARGARRLMRQIRPPKLCILVDGHGGQGKKDMGRGVFFTEKTSEGAALVTPPDLFVKFKNLVQKMNDFGINIFEDQGRVSRGDDVACLEVTSQILSVGYPSINRHYDFGVPEVSLADLQQLSKVLFWIGMYFGTDNG